MKRYVVIKRIGCDKKVNMIPGLGNPSRSSLLDHDGNIVDCAGIAAIAALLHFRRPDVTVIGEEVTIVSVFLHKVAMYAYIVWL